MVSGRMAQSNWLVTGASGFLGSYVSRALRARGYQTVGQAHSHLGTGNVCADLTLAGSGVRLVEEIRPTVVVNCVALANVDLCDREPMLAQRLNADLCGELADGCDAIGATFVSVSTDQLWRNPPKFVTEDETPDPFSTYGRTKADGEVQAGRAGRHIIIRTNFFGTGLAWRPSLSDLILARLRAGEVFNGFSDVYYTPIAVALASEWIVDMAEAGLTGTFHLGGRDRISKYEFAVALATAAGLDPANIKSGVVADAKLTAARPNEMSLNSAKIERALGRPVPDLDQSIRSALMPLN